MNAAEFELRLLELLARRFPGREMEHEDRERQAVPDTFDPRRCVFLCRHHSGESRPVFEEFT